MDEWKGFFAIFGTILVVTLVIAMPIYFIGTSTVYDSSESDILTINDLEIGYEGSACVNGLLRFRRVHIRTGIGTGVSLKNWVSPVLCEE